MNAKIGEKNWTRYHMRIDLKGALRNWKDSEWRNCVTNDEGRTLCPGEVKEIFLTKLLEGIRFIPMDSSCDNFDPEKGCMGHPCTEGEQP